MTDRRRIVAMGGGGYASEPDNPLLDQVPVRLAARRRARPTVCPHDGEEQRRPTYRRLVAFRVERTDSGVVETPLPTRFLGASAGTGDSR